jgi:FixJ family two-component response regulator
MVVAPFVEACADSTVPEPKTLHIVDHEGARCRRLAAALTSLGLRVKTWTAGDALLAGLDPGKAGCVLVEQDTSSMAAIEISRRLRLRGLTLPVIAIHGENGAEGAWEALRTCHRELALEGLGSSGERESAEASTSDVPRVAVDVRATGPGAFPAIEVLRERVERLTVREREVAQLVAQGYSSKELARALSLSKSTVDNHRARILEKLQLANAVQVTRVLSLLLEAR